MASRIGRVVVSVVLAPYIAVSAVVAQEHLHEADAEHPHSVVHRHLDPHSVGSHDHHEAQLAGDDEHVVWLGTVALHQAGYHFAAPALPPTARFQLVPPLVEQASPPDYDTAPAHGPPRACLSLRAPPCLSA